LVWLLFNDLVGFMSPAFSRIWRLLPIIGFAVKNFRAASGLPFGLPFADLASRLQRLGLSWLPVPGATLSLCPGLPHHRAYRAKNQRASGPENPWEFV
jgi:hypothetical protein